MVETFEILADGQLRPMGTHGTIADASSSLPQGSYTTLRTYRGDRVLRLDQHVGRLVESLAAPAPLELTRVRRGLAVARQRLDAPDCRFRLTFSPPRLFVSLEPFEAPPGDVFREGIRCITLPLRRENPHAKDTRFIARARDAYARLTAGVSEGLLLGEDGAILEGLTSNFFALLGGVLHSEEARALKGVTRSLVLELARDSVPLSSAGVRVAELPSVAEAFITSVSREILPVAEVDGRAIGDGRPGAFTRELMRRLAGLIEREAVPLSSEPA